MKTLQKSLLVAGGTVIGIAVAGGMFAYEGGHFGDFSDDDSLRIAIESDDYDLLSPEVQEKISGEKFESMADHFETQTATQAAIQNGDYDAFLKVADERIINRVKNAEEFETLVEREALFQSHQQALEAAISSNDFEAYKTTIESQRDAMDSMKPDHAPVRGDERHELTEDELQERFENMVEYYADNGKLPQPKKNKRGDGHKHGQRDC